MIEDKKIEDLDDLLNSVEKFASQAKQIAFNLASAASRSRNSLPLRISDDILELVTQTVRATEEMGKMIKIMRMEIGSLYSFSSSGEIEFEKNSIIQEKIERYLQNVLTETQRILQVMRKLKSISLDHKL
jgi:hypothetical protein